MNGRSDRLNRNSEVRSLCPERDERAAMSDGEFWDRVARNLGHNTDPDDLEFDLDPQLDVGLCDTCGSTGACGYDSEGRALIHASTEDDQ